MTHPKRLILILTIAALVACSASPSSELSANRQKWQSQQITHYRFSLSVGCFCAFTDLMPVTIEVDNGKVISMVDKDGQPAAQFQDAVDQYATVEKLFGVIDSAVADHAYQLTVDYDPDHGYPRMISIDDSENVADDEITLTVTSFQALPWPRTPHFALRSRTTHLNSLTPPAPGGIVAPNMNPPIAFSFGTMTMSTTPRISRGASVVGQG